MTATGRDCNVLIVAHFKEHLVERLQSFSPGLHIVVHPGRDGETVPAEVWRDAEVAYTFANHLPEPEQAPHLRWVQLFSAGAEMVLDHPLFHTEVRFTTTSGIHAVAIAEYVLATTLAWFQRLPALLQWKQQHEWHAWSSGIETREEIQGKTIGIVGYGSIGRQVARLAKSFGMRVLAMQRSSDHRDTGFTLPGQGDPEGVLPERYYAPEELHALLHESDVVVIALPLTRQTHYLFNAEAFNAMKPSAFLINIARGDICDEDALIDALREKRIAGAALDVFHREPLPADSPLWDLPNVIMSPHVTGWHAEYVEHAAMVFEENLRRYLAGEPLINEVHKELEY